MLSNLLKSFSNIALTTRAANILDCQTKCSMAYLNLKSLTPAVRSIKKQRIRGRGNNGVGNSCGRGQVGMGKRGSVAPDKIEGTRGNVTFIQRARYIGPAQLPKESYYHVDLIDIQQLIERGRLDITKVVTEFDLYIALRKYATKCGIKVHSRGIENFTYKINLETSFAQPDVISTIESNGGSFKAIYTGLELKECWTKFLRKPHSHIYYVNRLNQIPSFFDQNIKDSYTKLSEYTGVHTPVQLPPIDLMKYYSNYKYRGFLSQQCILDSKNKSKLHSLPSVEPNTSDSASQQ